MIGVDEAGRGPAIGPLVVASLAIPKEDVQRLIKMGVRDSKRISKTKREMIEKDIFETMEERDWKVCVIPISPESINISRSIKSLNEIEEEAFIEAIESVSSADTNAKVNLDPIGNNPKLFAMRVYNKLHSRRPNLHFESRKGMDDKCAVTGAASIVAKQHRDRVISDLSDNLGFNLGSGYPSDPTTIEALNQLTRGDLPHVSLRWTWATTLNAWKKNHTVPIPIRTTNGTVLQRGLNPILWTKGVD